MDVLMCDLCGKTVSGTDQAIEDGWEPYYWITDQIHKSNPVCGECSNLYLQDHSNDPILKPGVKLPRNLSL